MYDDVCKHYPEHKIVAADSAYKTPWICKRIFESGRILTSAYTRPKTKDGNHPWYTYVYDEFYDDVICPEYRLLHYATTNRDIYKLRQQKIERVFADAKEKHGMRYTQYRGLAQVTNWVKLKFAAMNLKKLATWKWKTRNPSPQGPHKRVSPPNFSLVFLLFHTFCQKSALA